ncbi:hypothetical protein E3N84_09980 [Terrimesophilobacter mesophilus]|uniref:Uncharacterized protein n=2 Tax=Terrimesophilobacter mesophilus TaxID=433647 RepID=A0A4R8VEP9_9MICO|nr:hypothetical protein [Terrimesophilobacter mesophilus]TFB80327.1 hypothetical protein E3N84_09980 [Terrimesophilobacter mesophilus]
MVMIMPNPFSAVLLVLALTCLILIGVVLFVEWLKELSDRRRTRIERELDVAQERMRAAIFQLASELGADAHEARKALIRESYLASGQLPPKQ